MGEVFEAILKRRSVRKYKSEEVSVEKIKKVLEAANWAKDYIPNAPYIPQEKKPVMLKYAENFGGALTIL